MLAEKANSMDDVGYLGYRVEHPLTGVITVTLKTKPGAGQPRAVLKRVIDSLGMDLDRLLVEVEKL
jgi:DNA-directed RNA polymerase subunit L